jgi:hypothetical protein
MTKELEGVVDEIQALMWRVWVDSRRDKIKFADYWINEGEKTAQIFIENITAKQEESTRQALNLDNSQKTYYDPHWDGMPEQFDGVIIKHNGGDWGNVAIQTAWGNYAIVEKHQEWAAEHIGETKKVRPRKEFYKTVEIIPESNCPRIINQEQKKEALDWWIRLSIHDALILINKHKIKLNAPILSDELKLLLFKSEQTGTH